MLLRYGFYEGQVRLGGEAAFDRNMEDAVIPALAAMPGLVQVRLLRGVGVGALPPRYHQAIELTFRDEAGLLAAMGSQARRDIGRAQAPSFDLFAGQTPHANFRFVKALAGPEG